MGLPARGTRDGGKKSRGKSTHIRLANLTIFVTLLFPLLPQDVIIIFEEDNLEVEASSFSHGTSNILTISFVICSCSA